MLIVCNNHIQLALQYLHAPHIAKIKDKNFNGCCVFCDQRAEYKLFYSVPISKSHRLTIQESIKKKELAGEKI